MSVEREDVIWCYRNLLGREAESEASIRSHSEHPDFKALVASFTSGQEFLRRAQADKQGGATGPFPLPLDVARLEVETAASDEDFRQCAEKIKTAWEFLGTERAHFSVLTDDDFLPANLAGSQERFWASGEHEAARAARIAARHGVTNLNDRICVEYGCGVGRVTMGFAQRAPWVHAYDISKPHLDFARARADELAIKNVTFHECSDLVNSTITPCDFFFSIIVFQHNPPPVILALIDRALAALRPDGMAVFQVPTYIAGYRFELREWLATDHALDMQMHCVPQDRIIDVIARQGCKLLEIREDNCAGDLASIISNTFVVRKPA